MPPSSVHQAIAAYYALVHRVLAAPRVTLAHHTALALRAKAVADLLPQGDYGWVEQTLYHRAKARLAYAWMG